MHLQVLLSHLFLPLAPKIRNNKVYIGYSQHNVWRVMIIMCVGMLVSFRFCHKNRMYKHCYSGRVRWLEMIVINR